MRKTSTHWILEAFHSFDERMIGLYRRETSFGKEKRTEWTWTSIDGRSPNDLTVPVARIRRTKVLAIRDAFLYMQGRRF